MAPKLPAGQRAERDEAERDFVLCTQACALDCSFAPLRGGKGERKSA
jgi:hypothetical protein